MLGAAEEGTMAVQSARAREVSARNRIKNLARLASRRGRGVNPRAEVTAALDELGAGWRRFDDIRWPGRGFADVDHVLVGPPGVFVIDDRAWAADVSLARADKGSGQTSVIDGLEMAAHAVGSLLAMTRNRPTPVLCFVGGMPVDTRVGAVAVTSTANIAAYLRSLPATVDDQQVALLAGLLRQRLIPATGLGSIPQQRAR